MTVFNRAFPIIITMQAQRRMLRAKIANNKGR